MGGLYFIEEKLQHLAGRVRNAKEAYAFAKSGVYLVFDELLSEAHTASEQLTIIKKHINTLAAYCGNELISLLGETYSADLLRNSGIWVNPSESSIEVAGGDLVLLNSPGDPLTLTASSAQSDNCILFGNEQRRVNLLTGQYNLYGHTVAEAKGACQVFAYDFSRLCCLDNVEAYFAAYSEGSLHDRSRAVIDHHACVTLESTTAKPIVQGGTLRINVPMEQCYPECLLGIIVDQSKAIPSYQIVFEEGFVPQSIIEPFPLPVRSEKEQQLLSERLYSCAPSELILPQFFQVEEGYLPYVNLIAKFKTIAKYQLQSDELVELCSSVKSKTELLEKLVAEYDMSVLLAENNSITGLLRSYYSQAELESNGLYLFDVDTTVYCLKDVITVVGAHNYALLSAGSKVGFVEHAKGIVNRGAADFHNQTLCLAKDASIYLYDQSFGHIRNGQIYAGGSSLVSAYDKSLCSATKQSLCLSHDKTRVYNGENATTIAYDESRVLAKAGTVYAPEKAILNRTDKAVVISQPEKLEAVRSQGGLDLNQSSERNVRTKGY